MRNAQDRGGYGPNNKVSLTVEDAGAQLDRFNTKWFPPITDLGGFTSITFAFQASSTNPSFSQFSSQAIQQSLLSIASFSDVARVTFTRVGGSGYSNDATILFGNYSSQDGAGGNAQYPAGFDRDDPTSNAGNIAINQYYFGGFTPSLHNYYRSTLTHELGHAMGLAHPGNYNAGIGVSYTYSSDAAYYEDSRQYSIMSYFEETATEANFNGLFSASLMIDDISALQQLYGVNDLARLGSSTYGFNNNTGADYYGADSAGAMIFAIWDAGGVDVIDLSGYSTSSTIDLRPGSFSSAGGLIGNISIAMGAVIEDAIGGSGDDSIVGNAAANWITGGGGNDLLTGGGGRDVFVFGAAGQGTDRITDFSIADDRFSLGGNQFTSAGTSSGDSVLTYAGGTITIAGITGLTLTQWNALTNLATSAPTLAWAGPADNATGVSVVSNIVLEFSENVSFGSGAITLTKVGSGTVETFTIGSSQRLTLVGDTLIIDPTRFLDYSSPYTLSVPAGALVSRGGASYGGLTGYDFTTQAAPTTASQFSFTLNGSVAAVVEGTGTIAGTTGGVQDVTVLNRPGTITFDPSFNAGGDRIHLEGVAADYSVRRNGSTLEITDGDTKVLVPIGINGADIIWADGVRSITFNTGNGTAYLGSQALTASSTPVTAGPNAPVATGTASGGAIAVNLNTGGSMKLFNDATVAGTQSGIETVHVARDTNVTFDPSFNAGGDVIVLPLNAGEYIGRLLGSTLELINAYDNSLVRIPVGPVGTTLRFTDTERTLYYDTGTQKVYISGQAFNAGYQTLYQTSAATLQGVDADNDANIATARTFSASGGNYTFVDDARQVSNVALTNFARGDVAELRYGNIDSYQFTSALGDIIVRYTGFDGAVSTLMFTGIADQQTYVHDLQSAIQAVGYEFATFVL